MIAPPWPVRLRPSVVGLAGGRPWAGGHGTRRWGLSGNRGRESWVSPAGIVGVPECRECPCECRIPSPLANAAGIGGRPRMPRSRESVGVPECRGIVGVPEFPNRLSESWVSPNSFRIVGVPEFLPNRGCPRMPSPNAWVSPNALANAAGIGGHGNRWVSPNAAPGNRWVSPNSRWVSPNSRESVGVPEFPRESVGVPECRGNRWVSPNAAGIGGCPRMPESPVRIVGVPEFPLPRLTAPAGRRPRDILAPAAARKSCRAGHGR